MQINKLFIITVIGLSFYTNLVSAESAEDRFYYAANNFSTIVSTALEACASDSCFADGSLFNPQIGERFNIRLDDPMVYSVQCLGSFFSRTSDANTNVGDVVEGMIGTVFKRRCAAQPSRFTSESMIRVNHICGIPPEDEPGKDDGGPCENGEGNPCNVATGNKFQTETDFSYGGLSFSRAYNSRNLVDIGLGHGWRMNYQPKLTVSDNSITLISKAGRGEPWSRVGSVWQGDADSELILEQSGDQFIVRYPNERTETYDANGRLLIQTSSNGFNTSYEYNTENQLISVTNDYGRRISFTYLDEQLSTVTDPVGAVYSYSYDDAFQNLTAVIFPDATPSDTAGNPRKFYHYEDSGFPNHLTGITDENGDRYATFAYDAQGKAISTEHSQTSNAVGQERFELDFQGSN